MRKVKIILSVFLALVLVIGNVGAAFAAIQINVSVTDGANGSKNFNVTVYSDAQDKTTADAENAAIADKSVRLQLLDGSSQPIADGEMTQPISGGASTSSFLYGKSYQFNKTFGTDIANYIASASVVDSGNNPVIGPVVRNFDAGSIVNVPNNISADSVNYWLNGDDNMQFSWAPVTDAQYYEVRGISNSGDLENYYTLTTVSQPNTGNISLSAVRGQNINYVYIVAYRNGDTRIARSQPVALKWISGFVSLPAGDSAGAGIDVQIKAERWNGGDVASQTVTLLGTDASAYRLLIPKNEDPNLVLRYEIPQANETYVQRAYLGNNNIITTRYDDRMLVQFGPGVFDIGGKNLRLIKGKVISGTIQYPGSDKCLSDNKKIYVECRNNYNEGATTEVTFLTNETQKAFAVVVPVNSSVNYQADDKNQYQLYYRLDMGTDSRYVNRGYFAAGGTTPYQGQADRFDSTLTEPFTNNALTLLPGQVITGTVSFDPNALKPLKNDVWVNISVEADSSLQDGSDRYYQDVNFNILKSSPSCEYTITVPINGTKPGYRVKSHVSWDTGFVIEMLYKDSAPGYTFDYDQVTKLNVGNTAVSGINFNLIPGTLITGHVYRSAAIAGNYVEFGIVALEASNARSASTGFSMGPGMESMEYQLVVPKTCTDYKFGYNLDEYRFGMSGEAYVVLDSGSFHMEYDKTKASVININNLPTNGNGDKILDINLIPRQVFTINGSVKIPNDVQAPNEPLTVRVEAKRWNGVISDWETRDSQNIVVTGHSGTTFSLKADKNGGDCIVTYEIISSQPVPFYKYGYFNGNGTTWDQGQADKLSLQNDYQAINMELLKTRIITGTVTLQHPVAQQAGIEISVNANANTNDDNPGNDINTGTCIKIPQGQTSGTYTLYVPYDANSAQYKVGYYIDPKYGYIQEGFYKNSDSTVYNWEEGTYVTVPGTVTGNINMNVYDGETISGTISLPQGDAAPTQDYWVRLEARGINWNGGSIKVNFKDTTSNAFSFCVPSQYFAGEDGGYHLFYEIESNPGSYLRNGYFGYIDNNPAVRSQWKDTVPVTAAGGGKDFTLFKGKKISGTISLPDEFVLAEPLSVDIDAFSENGTQYDGRDDLHFGTKVTIPAGTGTSVPYEIYVADDISDNNYKVHYNISGVQGLVSEGYYSTAGTVAGDGKSSKIAATGDSSDCNLNILEGYAISGSIRLPKKVKYEQSDKVKVQVFARDEAGNGSSKWLDIPNNDSGVPVEFTLNVPGNGDYYAWYEMDWPGYQGWIQSAGLTVDGSTTWNKDDYTVVHVGSTGVPDVNLNILQSKVIQGNIFLPDEMKAANRIDVDVEARNDNDTPDNWGDDISFGTHVTIEQGQGGSWYMINIPMEFADRSYKVSYHVNITDSDNYVKDMNFLWFQDGNKWVTFRQNEASDLDMTSQTEGFFGIDMPLLQAVKVTGMITLPKAIADNLPDGNSLNVKVNLWGDNCGTDNWVSFSKSDLRNAVGDIEKTYQLRVPSNKPGDISKYQLVYTIEEGCPDDVLNIGFYSDSGTTALRQTAAELQVENADIAGKNLTVVQGKLIKGLLKIPGAHDALNIEVRAQNDNNTGDNWDDDFYTSVFKEVSAGSSSVDVPYSLVVPLGFGNNKYRVSYWIAPGKGFAQEGFYAGQNGTLANYDQAVMADVSGGNQMGIDLNMLAGNTVSGTLSINGGYPFPQEGIKVNINVRDANGNGYTEGYNFNGSEIPYSITVPAGKDYCVSYDISGQNLPSLIEKASVAWDNQGNSYFTSADWNQAWLFDLSNSGVNDVDIQLIKGRIISGRIILPDGQMAPESMWLEVNATPVGFQQGNSSSRTYVEIKQGEGSAYYELTVPESSPGPDYKIGYRDFSGMFVGEMHYRDNVDGNVTFNFDKGSIVNISGHNAALKDMKLVPGTTISGTVTRPAGVLSEELRVGLNLWSDNGGTGLELVFEPGQDSNLSLPYSFTVPNNDSMADKYYLSYHINKGGTSGMLQDGLYNSAGTTLLWKDIEPIQVSPEQPLITGKNLSILSGRTISGTITVPGAHPDMEIDVHAEDIRIYQNNDEFFKTGTTVHVNAGTGTATADYSIAVPDNINCIVSYNVKPNQGYAQQAYYVQNSAPVCDWEAATIITAADSDLTGINLSLLPGLNITGTVSLPEDETAPEGGIWVNVNASNDAGGGFGTQVLIEEGASSAGFELTVAPGTYRLSYQLGTYTHKHVWIGFYNITDSTAATVSRNDLATPLDVSQSSISGISMTLIPGREVSGRISLPTGYNPGKDIPVKLRFFADNGTEDWQDDLNLKRGPIILNDIDRFVDYTTVVPMNEAGTRYIVSYETDGDSKIAQEGFYCGGATLANEMNASWIDLAYGDISNVNFDLIPGRLISGTISLDAPAAQDTYFSIEARDLYGNGARTKVVIEQGSSSFDYKVCVPINQLNYGYTVAYHMDQGDTARYYSEGFYGENATTANRMKAKPVDVSNTALTGINIKTIKLGKITGTVRLPGSAQAASSINVTIMAADEDSGFYQPNPATVVTIPSGSNSQPFEMTVPVDDSSFDYKLLYVLDQGGTGYAQVGYLGNGSTVANNASAVAFSLESGDKTGTVVELLPGRNITGKVKLPFGETADDDIYIDVYAIDNTKTIFAQSTVKILKGGTEGAYTLTAVAGIYNVTYRIGNSAKYTPGGYYSSNGTVIGMGSATSIDISTASQALNDMTLLETVVSVPKAAPKYGTTIKLPVYIKNAWGLAGIQFTLKYDPSVLLLTGVKTDAIAGFTGSVNLNGAEQGTARVAMASSTAISGDGVLCYLTFTVRGNINGLSSIDITDSEMNNVWAGILPFTAESGRVKVAPVTYGNVDLNGDEKVTAADATLVLRAAAELISLSPDQRIAADVNGDGIVNTGDATLILQWAVQLIDRFPVESK